MAMAAEQPMDLEDADAVLDATDLADFQELWSETAGEDVLSLDFLELDLVALDAEEGTTRGPVEAVEGTVEPAAAALEAMAAMEWSDDALGEDLRSLMREDLGLDVTPTRLPGTHGVGLATRESAASSRAAKAVLAGGKAMHLPRPSSGEAKENRKLRMEKLRRKRGLGAVPPPTPPPAVRDVMGSAAAYITPSPTAAPETPHGGIKVEARGPGSRPPTPVELAATPAPTPPPAQTHAGRAKGRGKRKAPEPANRSAEAVSAASVKGEVRDPVAEAEAELAALDPDSKEAKKQRRLLRNRLSAQLHRERKRAQITQLEDVVKGKDAELASLRQENLALRRAQGLTSKALQQLLQVVPPERISTSLATLLRAAQEAEAGDSSGQDNTTSESDDTTTSPVESPRSASPVPRTAVPPLHLSGPHENARKRPRQDDGTSAGSTASAATGNAKGRGAGGMARNVMVSTLGLMMMATVMILPQTDVARRAKEPTQADWTIGGGGGGGGGAANLTADAWGATLDAVAMVREAARAAEEGDGTDAMDVVDMSTGDASDAVAPEDATLRQADRATISALSVRRAGPRRKLQGFLPEGGARAASGAGPDGGAASSEAGVGPMEAGYALVARSDHTAMPSSAHTAQGVGPSLQHRWRQMAALAARRGEAFQPWEVGQSVKLPFGLAPQRPHYEVRVTPATADPGAPSNATEAPGNPVPLPEERNGTVAATAGARRLRGGPSRQARAPRPSGRQTRGEVNESEAKLPVLREAHMPSYVFCPSAYGVNGAQVQTNLVEEFRSGREDDAEEQDKAVVLSGAAARSIQSMIGWNSAGGAARDPSAGPADPNATGSGSGLPIEALDQPLVLLLPASTLSLHLGDGSGAGDHAFVEIGCQALSARLVSDVQLH